MRRLCGYLEGYGGVGEDWNGQGDRVSNFSEGEIETLIKESSTVCSSTELQGDKREVNALSRFCPSTKWKSTRTFS